MEHLIFHFQHLISILKQRFLSSTDQSTSLDTNHEVLSTVERPLVLQVLNRSFKFSNDDEAKWWNSTAPMFAVMLQSAKYDVHAQYNFLCLYREFVLPVLGPHPTVGQPRHWNCTLMRYGLPFELSFNYSQSLLRFAFEPLGPLTGTKQDPFNTQAIKPLLHDLTKVNPGLDRQWFDHFAKELLVSDTEARYFLEQNLPDPVFKSQNKLAADLRPNGDIQFKAYFYPKTKSIVTGVSNEKLMFDAIRKIDTNGKLEAPLTALEAFLASRSDSLLPHFLACDLIDPSKARIKIYFFETQVNLESMVDIWTLGGKRKDSDTTEGLKYLKELWESMPISEGRCPLPNCFYEVGNLYTEQLPFIINFAIYPNKPLPEPQIYFACGGRNDKETAEGLQLFFNRRGWKGMAQSYISDLSAYYPEQNLEETTHLQTWFSYSMKKGKPYLTVYLHSFGALQSLAH